MIEEDANVDGEESPMAEQAGPVAREGGPASAWSRPTLTLRLTKERKRALLALLPADAPTEGPNAAVDRAIGLARGALANETLTGGALPDPELAKLSAELADAARAARESADGVAALQANFAALASGLAAIARDVAALRGEIAHAADMDAGSAPASLGQKASTPLRDWLDRVCGPGPSWAVVEARFRNEHGSAPGWATWEFEARLLSAEGLHVAEAGELHPVHIGPERRDATSVNLGQQDTMVFHCRRAARGWSIAAHAVDDGKIGPLSASFEVR